jgi:hypothetical protein
MTEIDWSADQVPEHEAMGMPDPWDLPDDGAVASDSPRLLELFAEAHGKAVRRGKDFEAARREASRRFDEAVRERAKPVTA